MKKRSHIFRGLASIFLALMVLFGTVMSVALSWEGRVNELLGISDDTFAKSQNPDDYYYKSDYEDPAGLIKAEIALNTRMEAEGAVALKGTPAVDGTGVTLFGMAQPGNAVRRLHGFSGRNQTGQCGWLTHWRNMDFL